MGSDWTIAVAEQDLPGSASFAPRVVVPKGTPNTINGAVIEGARLAVTCYWDISEVTLLAPYFKLTGILRMMDNARIFVPGDPVSVEGNADAGEFTWTIRGAGQDRGPTNYTGQILIMGGRSAPVQLPVSRP